MDGKTDLVLRNSATNAYELWLLDGVQRTAELPVTPGPAGADWRVVGADDFNDDQRTDLVFWNQVTGAVEFWMLKTGAARWGAAVPLSETLAPPWFPAATGDFNHDGAPDILWRNDATQKLIVWTLNGATKIGEIVPTPDQAQHSNWAAVAALDYNADGNRDLLWYNATTGKIVLWYMDANVVRMSGNFTNPQNAGDANWKVVAGSDYGIGPPPGLPKTNDIVWRNDTSGRLVVWYMDNAGNRTAGLFFNPSETPPGYQVVGPK